MRRLRALVSGPIQVLSDRVCNNVRAKDAAHCRPNGRFPNRPTGSSKSTCRRRKASWRQFGDVFYAGAPTAMPPGPNKQPGNLACNRRFIVAVALARMPCKYTTYHILPNICACPLYLFAPFKINTRTLLDKPAVEPGRSLREGACSRRTGGRFLFPALRYVPSPQTAFLPAWQDVVPAGHVGNRGSFSAVS
jgi:hypothetical protein